MPFLFSSSVRECLTTKIVLIEWSLWWTHAFCCVCDCCFRCLTHIHVHSKCNTCLTTFQFFSAFFNLNLPWIAIDQWSICFILYCSRYFEWLFLLSLSGFLFIFKHASFFNIHKHTHTHTHTQKADHLINDNISQFKIQTAKVEFKQKWPMVTTCYPVDTQMY